MLKRLAFKKFKPLDYSIICIIKMYPVKWVLTNIFTQQTATALRMEQLQILQVPCPPSIQYPPAPLVIGSHWYALSEQRFTFSFDY